VLDGGWPAWVAAGGAVETGPVVTEPGDFRAGPGRLAVLDAAGARVVAERGALVDARAPERFRGETEPVDPVAGRIPGAVNVPTARTLHQAEGAPGCFRDLEDLRVAFADALTTPGPVAAYCGSGVTAAHAVLALDLLGVEAALYAGSWSDWVTDPDRPVATGA
jgi:thiosulfate/3-mercaptopyruvate sulfurtransferase